MSESARVTQTVILAAGSGSRLVSTDGDVPKPLMTVGGISLIEHALVHAHAAGCTDAVIVVGHQGGRVRAAIESLHQPLRVRFLTSPDPSLPNGVSLSVVEPAADGIFYLQMVDHVFADVALRHLSSTALDPGEAGRVLVDRAPADHLDLDDATRVKLEGRCVRGIGKGLAAWDAIDAGCFLLTHAVFDALRAVAEPSTRTVSSAMRQLAASGRLFAVDVNGIEWADVDTPADRYTAERVVANLASKPGV